jgi:hypothetical protein
MVSALRPGGWLLVEDADYISCAAATPNRLFAGAFDRTVAAIMADACARGLYDPYIGRRLAALVAGGGLIDTGSEGLVFARSGGSGAAEFFAQSIVRIRDELVERGIVTAADVDRMLAALRDPTFSFLDAVSFAAWGRRWETRTHHTKGGDE